MSFSSKIKEEILKKLSKKEYEQYMKLEKFGESLTQTSLKNDLKEEFDMYFDLSVLTEKDIKVLLKGVFLGSGCVVDPERDYHLELTFKNKACMEYIYNLLSLLEFTPRTLKRKTNKLYVIYIKEADQISKFLSIIEVSNAVLTFEQVRVEKEVKNNINRSINCETANLAKSIKTSVKQIEAINKLKKEGKFDMLNKKLKDTANLRIKYPNESLDYLAKKTLNKEAVSKSGIKHRLDKIIELASKI